MKTQAVRYPVGPVHPCSGVSFAAFLTLCLPQAVDQAGQPGFVAGGGVGVDDAFSGRSVEERNGRRQRLTGGLRVRGGPDLFEGCPER